MTIRREPLSIHAAIFEIGNKIGFSRADDILGKHSGEVYKLANRETGRKLLLQDAILLDRAFLADGGNYPPLLTAYQAQVQNSETAPNLSNIVALVAVANSETGEALARALTDGIEGKQLPNVKHEIDEAIISLTALSKAIEEKLRR